MSSPCFGIDLGTTASAIALVREGRPQVLAVDGAELLPSAILLTEDGEILVGQPALNAMLLAPGRGVMSAKRHMGTEHSWTLGDRRFTPVDVAAELLRRLCDGAAESCGMRPERVVITVPAWFTNAQRADTRRAGERAGLQVERVINEPTAAALAHAHGQGVTGCVLVYDLGGGTFDVSLVNQEDQLTEVRASHGDTQLGGDDVDLALLDLVLRRLAESRRPLRDAVDASDAARFRLRLAVEAAKRELSTELRTMLRVPFLVELEGEPAHLEMELDREDVASCARPFLERTLSSVQQVLADGGIRAEEVDELLLVGGSTQMPAVWHLLHDQLGLEGSHALDPRRVVALGAAIQAAIVDGSRTDGILLDVAPYALSVGTSVGISAFGPEHFLCRVITPRNAPLPARHAERFFTVHPSQDEVEIPVYQGASPDPRNNALLGNISIGDLDPAPEGEDARPILVDLHHDLDGIVTIHVTDELSDRTVQGRVAADGEEQAELHQSIEERVTASGLIYGYGDEPTESDQTSLFEETPKAPLAALPASDVSEARETFAALLAARARVEAAHPEHADSLLSLAEVGLAALDGGEESEGLDAFDQLSDAMFLHGVYL